VVEGDTIDVAGVRVRLKGLDAAERGTERGDEPTQIMKGSSATVRCTVF
jgi:endonuclease YncB( thermonuclease family)